VYSVQPQLACEHQAGRPAAEGIPELGGVSHRLIDVIRLDLIQPGLFVRPSGNIYGNGAAEHSQHLLGRAIDGTGHEGPAELRKLEALQEALAEANAANRSLKRTLAGAVIELDGRRLCIEAAPARRKPPRRTAARTR